jgi:hypothetical protein
VVLSQEIQELRPQPEQFFVIPLRLYLFGSLRTDKPTPGDTDLLFEYREQSDLEPRDIDSLFVHYALFTYYADNDARRQD